MISQKTHWETLAQKNARYYINSDKGRNITEEDFRTSGKLAYQKCIASDKLLTGFSSILDFGCGTGRLTEFMARDFTRVVGVDISKTMIELAKTRLRKIFNIDLIETDGNTIPLPDNSIDIVFAYLVFQHIKTREMVESLFGEIFRVLIPEGIFKVLLRSDKQKDMNRWWSGVEFSQESIRKLYEKIGFKTLKSEYQNEHAFWLWLQK